ncbi:hypothetical protein ACVIHC_002177 [Bradyrhizobium diazoefficiens]
MAHLSNDQKKQILGRCTYTLTTNRGVLFGKLLAFDQDGRGFGAVVVFPNGTRGFWGVDDWTLQAKDLGIPPLPRRKAPQARKAIPTLLLPRWR